MPGSTFDAEIAVPKFKTPSPEFIASCGYVNGNPQLEPKIDHRGLNSIGLSSDPKPCPVSLGLSMLWIDMTNFDINISCYENIYVKNHN